MVTDQQVRRLFKLIQSEKKFGIAVMKAGMDEKTARKYREKGKLPSELKQGQRHRTRKDPFDVEQRNYRFKKAVEQARAEAWSYEQYLLQLLTLECEVRRQNRISRNLRASKLP
jgi:hypothetical protein